MSNQEKISHTGWVRDEDNKKQIFITSNGAIGSDDQLKIRLKGSLKQYALPSKPKNVKEAVAESLKFLDIAPLTVTAPLWAAMYLAPLNPFLALDFAIWLSGPKRKRISALAALALSHFGNFTKDTLPASWDNEIDELEKMLFLAKDVPFVIDNFAPQDCTSKTMVKKLETKANKIIQLVKDKSEKSQSDQDIYVSRGLVLSTGKAFPSGQRATSHVLRINVDPEDIDTEKLAEAQRNAFLYPHAMAAYIQWVSDRWNATGRCLYFMWKGNRRTKPKVLQTRLTEINAYLSYALRACQEIT